MIRLGVISNPRSDGNAGTSALAGFAEAQTDVAFAAPASLAELPSVLADFVRRGVGTLAVDGGDGTLRDVLSALPPDGDWPAIALLPSGKTNLVASDVGSWGSGVAGLRRLLDRLRGDPSAIRWAQRPCLEIVRRDDPSWLVRGFLLGGGVFVHATRMSGTWAHRRGIKRGPAVILTLARVAWQSLRGHPAAQGAMNLSTGAAPPRPCFLLLATTLERLMLGFWPFPPQGGGPLHWLVMWSPPHRLTAALWAAWRGRLRSDPDRGCEGGRTGALSLRLDAPFVVDGELFEPGGGGVLLRTGPSVRFVV